ncbi:DDE transposase family protein [Microcoleus sp. FACHB-672]|uniref:DDE transposase family protein n=1 Tax=Microcoleus sp. FACHB-672 TaxID=2692825 RepID=UPI0016890D38|nr:DDE transposase family protein [Microcoleus sp. FACHB-672]MBD2041089.1 DDE transposase family protein [Microcoleus sp. FACHB-672]
METSQSWYIVKRPQGSCEILPAEQIEQKEDPNIVERWGPFTSPDEAIARRVGLIRTGKCQPQ